ncbi:MAG: hypothetical protein P8129_23545, partial [Anaerolineae bacterium]
MSGKRLVLLLLLVGSTLGSAVAAWFPVRAEGVIFRWAPGNDAGPGEAATAPQGPEQSGAATLYLPMVYTAYPWISPFGVEPSGTLGSTALMDKAVDLGTRWVRLNRRISWRALQPTEGATIDWGLLADFENELRALQAQGMTPMVIVDDHPEWATI